MKLKKFVCFSLTSLLVACQMPIRSTQPTLLPTGMIPTVIVLTMQASRPTENNQKVINTDILPEVEATYTQPAQTQISFEPSLTVSLEMEIVETPVPVTNNQPVPPSQLPLAEIQLRGLGQLSRVTSPLTVNAYLKPGADGKVQVDLLGEDRRLLARVIKVLSYIDEYGKATLYLQIPFEISALAEAGRLVISVADDFGRTTSLLSIPLILISVGEADIFPPTASLAPIAIQVPAPKTLIQGKSMVVYGWASPSSDNYLMVQLISEDGKIVGKRVTKVGKLFPNGYGNFTVEVPYFITETVPALLVVWEGDGNLSNVINLSSVEVMLSP